MIGGVYAAAFAPDGSRLVTAGFNGAQVWDAVRWQPQRGLRGHGATVICANDDDLLRTARARFAREVRLTVP